MFCRQAPEQAKGTPPATEERNGKFLEISLDVRIVAMEVAC